ncbi:lasso peptide biosynthesis protein [Paenibacillus alvei]|uniref:Microcin J25-processing protein McjB C-terminal domain-containing protein n=1 Tax=Paenibacillus alvei TaxID=44250 RepID=A0A383R7W2_PAEAL|nr:lasso peptide biosynthesis protein [Paenibacillus alvei]SYX82416.1 conserved protein of unknown function [Paenibacillus alvei]
MINLMARKQSDYKLYALMIHALIRNMLREDEFIQSYRRLAVQLFPFFESAVRRNDASISAKRLNEIGRYLFMLDEEDQAVATCVSVAATIQAIQFCLGIQSELHIGVKKIDEKLFAHAWVKLPEGDILDPQNKYKDLQIIRVLKLKDEAERWATTNL